MLYLEAGAAGGRAHCQLSRNKRRPRALAKWQWPIRIMLYYIGSKLVVIMHLLYTLEVLVVIFALKAGFSVGWWHGAGDVT